MADMAVGEWLALSSKNKQQELPFAYTNDLRGKHRGQAGMV